MRWLFLFVLSLNLAYFAWQSSREPADSYADVEPLKNVPPIVLLNEVSTSLDELEADSTDTVASSAADTPAEGDEPVEKPAVADASVRQSEDVSSAEAETTVQLTTDKESQLTAAASTAEKTAKTQPSLVTEGGEVQPAEPAPAALQSAQLEGGCFTLGPFRDLDKLRSLTREIKSYVTEADFRGKEERGQAIYWVYLTPEKSRKEAIETGKRLKSRKIKDFYIIRDGAKVNGISLGHFRNKTGAYGLAKKVTNLGFDVNVEPIFKSYTIYWLDYQLAEGVTIPEKIFDKYTTNTNKDKVTRLKRECDG